MKKKRLAAETVELLMAYDWRRNNVRELRNIVERMIIAAEGETIGPELVPAEIRMRASGEPSTPGTSFQDLREDAERRIVIAALERNGWQITRTAAELGLADHASLLKIMRRLDIKRSEREVS
jgi:DNA-binding NtrC family response regulator